MKRILYFSYIGLITIVLSCNNSNKQEKLSSDLVNNPITADGNVDTSMMPKFKFNEEIHEFGKIMQGEVVSYAFKFKNIGKSDLLIMSAKASCGCTVPEYPQMPIKPGEEGVIRVTFNSDGRKGIQSKTVTILANTQPNVKELKITADVTVPGN